jgi:DDE superfamily endonuclease
MTTQPYASAQRVFWIVDNGSSHAGKTSVQRLQTAWPNLILVHLPVHASWLNQIEIYFSILQRKALTPRHFHNLDELAGRITAFQAAWQQRARPIDWRYTRRDLNDLLDRLNGRHHDQPSLDRTYLRERPLADMHDEWQAGDRRYLTEGSMALLYPDSDRRASRFLCRRIMLSVTVTPRVSNV